MSDHDWQGISAEILRKLRHHPLVVARCAQVAQELAARANQASVQFSRPSERGNPNFGVTIQNSANTKRARVFVRPLGRTGIHVEQAESVLLKLAGSMGATGASRSSDDTRAKADNSISTVGNTSSNKDGASAQSVNLGTFTNQFRSMQ